jgi:CBS domain-containing protein
MGVGNDYDDWQKQHQKRLDERRRMSNAIRNMDDQTRRKAADDLRGRYWGRADTALPPPPPSNAAPAPISADEDVAAMNATIAPDVTVRDLKGGGDPSLMHIQAGTSVLDATRYLAIHRIGLVLVVDDHGALVGVLSERDIIRAVGANGPATLEKPVDLYVTADVVTCRSSDKLADVARFMSDHRFRHMPIVDDGVLQGMISASDIVRHMASHG